MKLRESNARITRDGNGTGIVVSDCIEYGMVQCGHCFSLLMDQGGQSTNRAASATDDGLQVWAVDISTWPKGASAKEELTPLVEELLRSRREGNGDDVQRVMRYVREIDRTSEAAIGVLSLFVRRQC